MLDDMGGKAGKDFLSHCHSDRSGGIAWLFEGKGSFDSAQDDIWDPIFDRDGHGAGDRGIVMGDR